VQGIAAISANNGWAMALAGACIVMTGLAVLAFVISQLHKIIFMLEGKAKETTTPVQESQAEAAQHPSAQFALLNDLPAAARFYRALSIDLGDTFPLAMLYRIFDSENQPHPHITIKTLREGGFLVPTGDGKYGWKNL
jgi:hypothetical protein